MASSRFLLLLSFLILISSSSSTPTPTRTPTSTITIPLSAPSSTKLIVSSKNPWGALNHLASLSLSRAHHIKSPKTKFSLLKTPLFPRSYGGYSISLNFGTPPQTTKFVMDTGSSLVWFPCTSRYLCSRCDFPNIEVTGIPTFIPKQSSSSNLIGCKNHKCSWLFGPKVQSKCQECDPTTQNCTQSCPPYVIQYGLGSTAGLLLSETLDFPHKKTIPGFLVGCSLFSIRQPEGIAGFGRSPESLPSQLGLKKFSYCLVSHAFDDTPASSDLVLDTGSGSDDTKTPGLSYTPFQKNPTAAFRDYYYVLLRNIVIGDTHVKVPYKFLVPGSDGNGGTIVDSGTTFTFMEKPVYELVAKEFEKQVAHYTVATEVQNQTGLRPCFNISGEKSVSVPEFIFHFKGGAKMALPLANYFSFVDSGVICLTIVSDNMSGSGIGGGPAIILGNYQQRNFHVEFDLKNERFGFKQQNCVS
ncbi:hypothetical protein POPTR_006G204700v4 [Populus trichocarpa]|uniref:Peptidase A1 domain-containing protein n=2 Tax=Populus trichocarpa TaxID=3694 RepID=B9HBQ5_POPTR|nr:probable aspartyl protease At4g16563 [Populus trichocarpa]KAI5585930.1 hypothetical protein BDE02_06G177000 [Populus trichocarpa]PNT32733.1 hypothetical protein POPTR_006G204700v4 [Populus trichocarpa]|eukprot:XP_002309394.1 probable aspartyl protease At4g16563 [Populus trichocarpa]